MLRDQVAVGGQRPRMSRHCRRYGSRGSRSSGLAGDVRATVVVTREMRATYSRRPRRWSRCARRRTTRRPSAPRPRVGWIFEENPCMPRDPRRVAAADVQQFSVRRWVGTRQSVGMCAQRVGLPLLPRCGSGAGTSSCSSRSRWSRTARAAVFELLPVGTTRLPTSCLCTALTPSSWRRLRSSSVCESTRDRRPRDCFCLTGKKVGEGSQNQPRRPISRAGVAEHLTDADLVHVAARHDALAGSARRGGAPDESGLRVRGQPRCSARG
jgi:hypothetical protein